MQGYLSIGEFAGLRHVNPKSLRYYERIGVLVPAYTDPDTGYRYYAPEQVIEMDMILMCLELGIPLREATRYRKSDGTLDIRRLLQEGQQKLQEKLRYLQNSLRQMEDALRRVETAEQVGNREGTYRRTLAQRMILREPFACDGGKLGFKQASARIFQKGQSLGLLPALLILPRFLGVEGALWAGPVGDACAFVLALILGGLELRNPAHRQV